MYSAKGKFLIFFRVCSYFTNNSNENGYIVFQTTADQKQKRKGPEEPLPANTPRTVCIWVTADNNRNKQKYYKSRYKNSENYSQGTFRIEADGPSPRLSPTEQKINAHDDNSELSEESAA